ncbi:MAG: transporter substrate-binding domain-containing protein [Moraxella sp.]|nr:transporter substrate-binding domain-containing protein [Moraxella sp.]
MNTRFLPITLALMAICSLSACNDDKPTAPTVVAPSSITLDKIKQSGVISLANRDSAVPFSYTVSDPLKPMGYSHDLQLKIVEAIKQELQMPDLKVEYSLVTTRTRIPLIENGTIDLECGATTNTAERAEQVNFSVGFFETGTRLLTAKNSGVREFSHLKGQTLVVTAGTTAERQIRQQNNTHQLGINIITADNNAQSFAALESGKARAFMTDDVLLAGEMAKAKDSSKWHIVGTPQSFETYGCIMPKGDVEFKRIVDNTLKSIYKSGEINNIYNKWFLSPIPPNNVNMNFPMSDGLKKLLATPHDKP